MALTPEALLKQQQFYGKLANGIAGAGSLFGQAETIANQGRGLATNAPTQQVDAYGRPIFNLGGLQQTVDTKSQGPTFGEALSGGLTGAASGASIGGPVGAAIGFGIGTLSNLFAGGARKRATDKNRSIALANLQNAQNMYNSSMSMFNNKQLGQGIYNDAQDTAQRMQNLFTYNTQPS